MAKSTTISIALTRDELALVCEALDSHVYWQLSDPHYRSSGEVLPPGADEDDAAAELATAAALMERLHAQLPAG